MANWFQRLWFFLCILWRRYHARRMDVRTAWATAKALYPKRRGVRHG